MSSKARKAKTIAVLYLIFMILLVGAVGVAYVLKSKGYIKNKGQVGQAQELAAVKTVKDPKDSYDVIVVGTDPEGWPADGFSRKERSQHAAGRRPGPGNSRGPDDPWLAEQLGQ